MKTRTWLGFILWSGSLVSCSSVPVSTDYDQSANFSNLQTYAWTTPSQQNDRNTLDDPRAISQIETAIDRQLSLKGFERVIENPDFLLASRTSFIQRAFTLQPYSQGSVSRPSRYQEGTMVIEIFNPKTRKCIWLGNARMVAGADDDRETQAKQFKEVVERILKEFPPPKKHT